MTKKTPNQILREISVHLPAFSESLEAHRKGWGMTKEQLVAQLRRCVEIVTSERG